MPINQSIVKINITKTVAVTPTISTSLYTTGDQVGGIMTLTDVVRQDKLTGIGVAELRQVTILDNSKQNVALDIWFFKVSPTVTSSDNVAFAMTAANQNLQCIGAVSVGTAYSAAAAVSTSTDGTSLGKIMQVDSSSSTPTSIYAIAVVRGAPTYATTSALQFQFSFYVD